MKVGIVGLGLIGGSFAKAYQEAGHEVLAFDRDESVLSFAQLEGAVSAPLTKENIGMCDLVLVAIYPEGHDQLCSRHGAILEQSPWSSTAAARSASFVRRSSRWPRNMALRISAATRWQARTTLASNAQSNLYHGAPMVLVPPVFDDIELLQRAKDLLQPAGFGKFSVTTAEAHDEMIAFTSQLAHVVSNAYIKSPTAGSHKGFSAGSYKDMTRVAWLNPQMWAELFLENRDYLMRAGYFCLKT